MSQGVHYTPDWPSLDSRPLPSWYDEAKIGVFMHWGPYSVPGIASEWFWFQWNRKDPNNTGDMEIVNYMNKYYPPDFKYQQFGSELTAHFFNATYWAELVEASGAKYFVLTSKHHDGFANWPSSRNFGWNSRDIGQKRDVVGELADAFRKEDKVKFGLYHSLFEWYHPLYLEDKSNNFTTRNFVVDKMGPELMEIINKYHPQVLWSDGDWETNPKYWDTLQFLSWLYSESPVKETVVTNDRWGQGVLCQHGDFFTCSDRFNPGVLQKHKWENAMTIDKQSWGFRRNMQLDDVLSIEELIKEMTITVSCGGNLLMNVGPNKDGVIVPIFEERLKQMGEWLSVNGEAIYGTSPWVFQNDSSNKDVWYTSQVSVKDGKVVYGILLEWPESGIVHVTSPKPGPNTQVTLLGFDEDPLEISPDGNISLPNNSNSGLKWAWVLKMIGLDNGGNSIH